MILNDIGEIRRVLNTLLQFIEQASSESIIIGATNHINLLDKVLFRRFDDILEYKLPDRQLIEQSFKLNLHRLEISSINWQNIVDVSIGLSFHDIEKICIDINKQVVLYSETISDKLILELINENKQHSKQLDNDR